MSGWLQINVAAFRRPCYHVALILRHNLLLLVSVGTSCNYVQLDPHHGTCAGLWKQQLAFCFELAAGNPGPGIAYEESVR